MAKILDKTRGIPGGLWWLPVFVLYTLWLLMLVYMAALAEHAVQYLSIEKLVEQG